MQGEFFKGNVKDVCAELENRVRLTKAELLTHAKLLD